MRLRRLAQRWKRRSWLGSIELIFTACWASTACAGSVLLTWEAPTERENGTALAPQEISAYRIYWRCGDGQGYPESAEAPGAVTQYVIENLPDVGRCYFVATTVDADGLESRQSNETTTLLGEVSLPSPPTLGPVIEWSLMTTLVQDTFTDTNGVDLTSHTPDVDSVGTGWAYFTLVTAVGANEIEIQGNALQISTSNKGAVIDIGVTDYVMQFDWTLAATGDNRIWCPIRWQDEDNHLTLNAREPEGDIGIGIWQSGGFDGIVARESFTFTDGNTYTIRAEVSGNNFEIYVDDNLIVSGTSALFNAGTHVGLGTATRTANQVFDNFLVETLGSATGSLTEGVSGAASFSGLVGAAGLLSGSASADETFDALAQAVSALNAGLNAGETWAASVAADAQLSAGASLGADFAGVTQAAQEAALLAGTEAAAAFLAAAASFASITGGAQAGGSLAGQAAASGAISAGSSLGAAFASTVQAIGSLLAAVEVGATFVRQAAIGSSLSEAVAFSDVFSATSSTDESLIDAIVTLHRSLQVVTGTSRPVTIGQSRSIKIGQKFH